jgi:hypothetical protein
VWRILAAIALIGGQNLPSAGLRVQENRRCCSARIEARTIEAIA